jgi:hypothetical protein
MMAGLTGGSVAKVFGKSGIVFLALCTAFIAGCSTVATAPQRESKQIKTRSVMPLPGSRDLDDSSGVLLVSEVTGLEEDEAADMTCRWRVSHAETGKSFFLTIKPSEPAKFVALDPGQYRTGNMGCGIGRVWDLDDVFKDGFLVEVNRASYIGKLIFDFKDKRSLETVRKGTRVESAAALRESREALPKPEMEIISGFTGRKIDMAIADSGNLREGFDVHATGMAGNVRGLDPLVTNLKMCANEESSRDPLRFGHLEYVAVYRKGRFSEMKDRQESNALSDRLRSCVERGIMAFHPTANSEIEVRVKY